MSKVFILLATYNGAAFLRPLVESICRQSFTDWRMLVRDDGSNDDTRTLLAELARADRRITLVSDEQGPQGAAQNFGLLMRQAQERGAEYVCFADQDDVWLPHKLQRQVDALREAEAAVSRPTPILAHSDLTVVDEDLRTIHPSLAGYVRGYHDPVHPLRTLLVYNFVTGCAATINRPLLDLALPLPPAVVMHDWWLAQCAAACGRIVSLSESTVLYRQHRGNVIGARGFWQTLNPLHPSWRIRWQRAAPNFVRSIEQAQALGRRIEGRIGRKSEVGSRKTQRDIRVDERHLGITFCAPSLIAAYCRLFEESRSAWQRYAGLRRLRIGRGGLHRQLTLAVRLLRLPREVR